MRPIFLCFSLAFVHAYADDPLSSPNPPGSSSFPFQVNLRQPIPSGNIQTLLGNVSHVATEGITGSDGGLQVLLGSDRNISHSESVVGHPEIPGLRSKGPTGTAHYAQREPNTKKITTESVHKNPLEELKTELEEKSVRNRFVDASGKGSSTHSDPAWTFLRSTLTGGNDIQQQSLVEDGKIFRHDRGDNAQIENSGSEHVDKMLPQSRLRSNRI